MAIAGGSGSDFGTEVGRQVDPVSMGCGTASLPLLSAGAVRWIEGLLMQFGLQIQFQFGAVPCSGVQGQLPSAFLPGLPA